MTAAQLGLFDDSQLAILEWQARFERAWWIAPHDTAGGLKAGERMLGWRCPDPACRRVESNSYLLAVNHGFDPDHPNAWAFERGCTRLHLLACQEEARREREARR